MAPIMSKLIAFGSIASVAAVHDGTNMRHRGINARGDIDDDDTCEWNSKYYDARDWKRMHDQVKPTVQQLPESCGPTSMYNMMKTCPAIDLPKSFVDVFQMYYNAYSTSQAGADVAGFLKMDQNINRFVTPNTAEEQAQTTPLIYDRGVGTIVYDHIQVLRTHLLGQKPDEKSAEDWTKQVDDMMRFGPAGIDIPDYKAEQANLPENEYMFKILNNMFAPYKSRAEFEAHMIEEVRNKKQTVMQMLNWYQPGQFEQFERFFASQGKADAQGEVVPVPGKPEGHWVLFMPGMIKIDKVTGDRTVITTGEIAEEDLTIVVVDPFASKSAQAKQADAVRSAVCPNAFGGEAGNVPCIQPGTEGPAGNVFPGFGVEMVQENLSLEVRPETWKEFLERLDLQGETAWPTLKNQADACLSVIDEFIGKDSGMLVTFWGKRKSDAVYNKEKDAWFFPAGEWVKAPQQIMDQKYSQNTEFSFFSTKMTSRIQVGEEMTPDMLNTLYTGVCLNQDRSLVQSDGYKLPDGFNGFQGYIQEDSYDVFTQQLDANYGNATGKPVNTREMIKTIRSGLRNKGNGTMQSANAAYPSNRNTYAFAENAWLGFRCPTEQIKVTKYNTASSPFNDAFKVLIQRMYDDLTDDQRLAANRDQAIRILNERLNSSNAVENLTRQYHDDLTPAQRNNLKESKFSKTANGSFNRAVSSDMVTVVVKEEESCCSSCY